VQTETIVVFLGNKMKFSSAVLLGSRSMVALATAEQKFCHYSMRAVVFTWKSSGLR